MADRGSCPDLWFAKSSSLRRDKIDSVERGDDLAAGKKFFQIGAILQFLVAYDPFPESGRGAERFGWAGGIGEVVHAVTF